jgi:hypothetical protein
VKPVRAVSTSRSVFARRASGRGAATAGTPTGYISAPLPLLSVTWLPFGAAQGAEVDRRAKQRCAEGSGIQFATSEAVDETDAGERVPVGGLGGSVKGASVPRKVSRRSVTSP